MGSRIDLLPCATSVPEPEPAPAARPGTAAAPPGSWVERWPDLRGLAATAEAEVALDVGVREAYRAANAARSAAARAALPALGGDAPGVVARSVSALRNELREASQGRLSPLGQALSARLEQDRTWGPLVAEHGNPFDPALAPPAREAAAEALLAAAGRSSPRMDALQALGTAALAAGLAQACWQLVRGTDELSRGERGPGALDAAEGGVSLALNLGSRAAARAGLLAGEAGAAAGALTLAASAASAGALTLAAETGRAALEGEPTPLEVADRFYRTHFADLYRWQRESPAVRAVLDVMTAGLSEAWFQLNGGEGPGRAD